MRYSVFNGGKRLRPILTMMACEAVGGTAAAAMPAACAIELIHTYSLIHDDLPSMDNDDYRRGKPSCHRRFDEATAILAGDALQAAAFGVLAEEVSDADRSAALGRELGSAAGSRGMVGGQALDLGATSKSNSSELERIHLMKTAAMFRAAARMGAVCAGAPPPSVQRLGRYGQSLGLAFQIVDDILDVCGTARDLGKTPGKDSAQDKATYPARFGLEKSRRRAELLIRQVVKEAMSLGARGKPLSDLAEFIIRRTR